MGAAGGRGSEATIYDVARAAGVSPSTVSRAFTRPGRVSAATTDKIRRVAEQLGYRGRDTGPARARADARVLGLWVSDITDPYNARVTRGCLAAANRAGFVVVLHDAHDSDEDERGLLGRSLPLVDGVVVASSRLDDGELRALAETVPVVVLNRRVPGLPCVVPDVAEGVRLAAEHLRNLGHRAVTYVSGPEGAWADGIRWRAIRATAHRLGIGERRVGPFPATVEGGHAAAEVIATRRVGAAICGTDLVALGLMRGLQERGLRVPGDVSIIGFDNIVAAALTTPSLTTVATPVPRLGDAAVRCVVAMVEHRRPEGISQGGPVRLIVRESTGPPAT